MPKVSVIVPSYNHARYLPQRMDSILSQTLQDFEVIIIDDASTDNSLEILWKYEKDPRVQLILNPANSGNTFKNWNAGARASSGEYLWIAESDDFADKLFLETLVAQLERASSIGLAYCHSVRVDDSGKILETAGGLNKRQCLEHWAEDYQANGKDEIANFLVFRNMIPNASAVVMRRRFFERIGFAAEDFSLAGDWHTWVRMLQISDISYCAKPLNFFRCHESTIRHRMSGKIDEVVESCRVFKYALSTMNFEKAKIEEILDVLVEKWWNTLRNHPIEIFSGKNLSIYRMAAGHDPHFLYRIAKKIQSKALKFMRPSCR